MTVFAVTDERPVIWCMVAKRLPDGEYFVKAQSVSLADAEDYASFGFEVWPDPWDLEALTRWQQWQDALNRKPRWQKW